jgi:hypothetical protein
MTNAPELVIDETNFDKHFFDVRRHAPKRGQVIARFTAVADLVDGRLKRDLIDLLKNTEKALPATNVMRKLGCCTEADSYRVCIEMTKDLLSGMSDDEVAEKVYEYHLESFYYTDPSNVPTDDPHWSTITMLNLNEFVDQAGTKLQSKWKFEDKKKEESV